MEDLCGQTIRQIKISSRLGKGGMGAVYVGEDKTLKRRVAVKVLHASRRWDDKATARFLREAQILSQLDHPNICNVFEFFQESEMDVLVLELIEGKNLAQLNLDDLKFTQKVKIARDVARALTAAHAQSVVHRDLKPQNVMLNENGQVKVLDFGLAHARGDRLKLSKPKSGSQIEPNSKKDRSTNDSTLTELGDIMGTPQFMSPEQARGETVTAASDMYSLGLLMQNLFTGDLPYPTELSSPSLLFKAMNADTLPVLGVDAQVSRLINALKSPNPYDRPTAGHVVEQLELVLNRPKRRLKITAIVGFIAVLFLGTLLSTIGFIKAKRSEIRATKARAQSEAVNAFLRTTLSAASPYELGIDVKVRDVLDYASEHLEEFFADDPLKCAAVTYTLGLTYMDIGNYEEARQHLEQAKALREKHLDPDDPDTLETQYRLGLLIGKQGELDRSEQLLKAVLERYQSQFGKDNRETLVVASSLATIYLEMKEFQKAEALHRQNLDLRRTTLGNDHKDTAASLNGLAIVMCNQQRFEEGEYLFREALEIKRQNLGHDHPSTLDTMHNLASALHVQAKYEAAEPLIRETLELTVQVMGPDHPSTQRTKNNLALVLSNLNKYSEAEQIFRETLATKRKLLGETHRSTLSTLNNLGMAVLSQGRLKEAESLFRETLEKRRQTLSPEHPDIPSSLENLADVLARQNKPKLAESMYEEALDLNAKAFGVNHPTTISLKCSLARARWDQGKFLAAKVLMDEALDQAQNIFGEDHPLTVEAKSQAEEWANGPTE